MLKTSRAVPVFVLQQNLLNLNSAAPPMRQEVKFLHLLHCAAEDTDWWPPIVTLTINVNVL